MGNVVEDGEIGDSEKICTLQAFLDIGTTAEAFTISMQSAEMELGFELVVVAVNYVSDDVKEKIVLDLCLPGAEVVSHISTLFATGLKISGHSSHYVYYRDHRKA